MIAEYNPSDDAYVIQMVAALGPLPVAVAGYTCLAPSSSSDSSSSSSLEPRTLSSWVCHDFKQRQKDMSKFGKDRSRSPTDSTLLPFTAYDYDNESDETRHPRGPRRPRRRDPLVEAMDCLGSKHSLDDSQVEALRAIILGMFLDDSPKQFILHGGPGCGKTHLCDRIAQIAEKMAPGSFLRCASTGIASLHIHGQTINSCLKLGHHGNGRKQAVQSIVDALEHVKGILIDEMSMISTTLLSSIDDQLRLHRPHMSDVPFGGIAVILAGDFFQLPPVGGTALYSSTLPKKMSKKANHNSIGDFKLLELTSQHRVVATADKDSQLITAINQMRSKTAVVKRL
jgi:DNA replication protein DnaC